MDILVGAEYVIANALIALSRKGQCCISFGRLRNIGKNIQQYCNKNGIDAVILTSNGAINGAICTFSEYFQYFEADDGIHSPMIRIRRNMPIAQLENRFVGYLPAEIIRMLTTKIAELVA